MKHKLQFTNLEPNNFARFCISKPHGKRNEQLKCRMELIYLYDASCVLYVSVGNAIQSSSKEIITYYDNDDADENEQRYLNFPIGICQF